MNEDTQNPVDHLAEAQTAADEDETLLLDELLVEDVSIDGMCGVY